LGKAAGREERQTRNTHKNQAPGKTGGSQPDRQAGSWDFKDGSTRERNTRVLPKGWEQKINLGINGQRGSITTKK